MKVFLFGGMANQLFQLQYGLFMKAKGYEVVFDSYYVPFTVNHGFDASHIGVNEKFVAQGLLFFGVRLPWSIARVLLKIRSLYLLQLLRVDNDYHCVDNPLVGFGYFQSFFYKNLTMLNLLRSCFDFDSCFDFEYSALHVRQGDYVGNRNYFDLTQYYVEVAAILKSFGLPVLVVTDDIESAKQIFSSDCESFRFVSGSARNDFKILLNAKNLAIANSSFSLLAGIYGNADNTYCPKDWFANLNLRNLVKPSPDWEAL